MAPTPPGYRLWESFTPLTVAASPLVSPWIDASGFSQVVPGFKFAGGTSTATVEASVDGTNLDSDLTTLYSAPVSGTAFPVLSPFIRFKVVQTSADATVTKIVLTSSGGGASASLTLVAATPVAGFALQNATPSIISWTPPNDGQMHRFMVLGGLRVTVAETGGAVQVSYNYPDGSGANDSLLAAGQSPTHQLVTTRLATCQGGVAVNVNQNSALSSGTATVWLEIWGA